MPRYRIGIRLPACGYAQRCCALVRFLWFMMQPDFFRDFAHILHRRFEVRCPSDLWIPRRHTLAHDIRNFGVLEVLIVPQIVELGIAPVR